MTTPSTMEDLQPLFGAARLAMFDVKGLTRIDSSRRGVLVSFIAPLVTLPLMLWIAGLQDGTAQEIGLFYYLRQALAYIVVVLGFPVAMYYIARLLSRGARYHLMVAAVNWTTPIQTALMIIGSVIYFWDLLPGVGEVILMLVSLYNMIYLWFTIRVSLTVSGGLAVLLVCLMAMIQLIGVLLTQVNFI